MKKNKIDLINLLNKNVIIGSKMTCSLIVVAILFLNLIAFSFLTTTDYGNDGIKHKNKVLSKSKTEKLEQTKSDPFVSINPELEIFQYMLRHTKVSHTAALKWAHVINKECNKYDIDPFLVLAVIKVESEFKREAVSNKGAVGLMQLMPSTAKYIAKKYKIPFKYKGPKSLYEPVINIKLGIAYLDYLESRYGNMEYALWSYNHGPKRYKEVKRRFKTSKPYYVKKVMNFKNFLESEKEVL